MCFLKRPLVTGALGLCLRFCLTWLIGHEAAETFVDLRESLVDREATDLFMRGFLNDLSGHDAVDSFFVPPGSEAARLRPQLDNGVAFLTAQSSNWGGTSPGSSAPNNFLPTSSSNLRICSAPSSSLSVSMDTSCISGAASASFFFLHDSQI